MRGQANADHSCSCTRNQNKMRNQNKQDIRRKIFLKEGKIWICTLKNFLRKINKDIEKNQGKLFIFMIEKTTIGGKSEFAEEEKSDWPQTSEVNGRQQSMVGRKLSKIFLLQQVQEILQVPRKVCFGFCLFDQRILQNAAGMCLFWWFSKAHLIYF